MCAMETLGYTIQQIQIRTYKTSVVAVGVYIVISIFSLPVLFYSHLQMLTFSFIPEAQTGTQIEPQ